MEKKSSVTSKSLEEMRTTIRNLKIKHEVLFETDPFFSNPANRVVLEAQNAMIAHLFLLLSENLENYEFLDNFLVTLAIKTGEIYEKFTEYPITEMRSPKLEEALDTWLTELENLLFEAKLRIILNSDDSFQEQDFVDFFDDDLAEFGEYLANNLSLVFKNPDLKSSVNKMTKIKEAMSLFVANFVRPDNKRKKTIDYQATYNILKSNMEEIFYSKDKKGVLKLGKEYVEENVKHFFNSLEKLKDELIKPKEGENATIH